MTEEEVLELLTKASESVATLPEHLQVKGFEIAVALLSGLKPREELSTAPLVANGPSNVAPVLRPMQEGALDLVDLLRVCKRNPDRYLVFMRECEDAGEAATSSALTQMFKTYKQDVPKLPSRDLDELVAKNWVDKDKSTMPQVFTLKTKGRGRLSELEATASVGAA